MSTDDGAASFYDGHGHPYSPYVKGWRGRPVKEVTVISALRQQGGPSPLWSGARRFCGPRPGRHDNVIRCQKSQAKTPVRSTVVRPTCSAVDLHQTDLSILKGE